MSDGVFHVVVERAKDGDALRLADAMAERYGLPADTLRARLGGGPLRVKSNVDLATAESFVADLEKLGAVCAILDAATGAPRAKPAPKPAAAKPAPMTSALAGIAAPARPSQPQVASGLAAAFSPSTSSQDLGVLGGDSGEFSLATLDGDEDEAPAPTPAGSADALPASFGPAAAPAPEPEAPAVHAAPLDPFAPPETADEDIAPVLDTESISKRSGQLATPLPGTLSAVPTHAPAMTTAAPPPAPAESKLATLLRDARVRLAAGVAAAILVGFIPATIVASMRESTANAAIDADIQKAFHAVTSHDDWVALDAMLAKQKDRKQDEKRNIALGSMLIWAIAGGAIAFVWFKKIDWDSLADKVDG